MEKKRYEELELEVVRFDAEDVVATSGSDDCNPYGCSRVDPNDGFCYTYSSPVN